MHEHDCWARTGLRRWKVEVQRQRLSVDRPIRYIHNRANAVREYWRQFWPRLLTRCWLGQAKGDQREKDSAPHQALKLGMPPKQRVAIFSRIAEKSSGVRIARAAAGAAAGTMITLALARKIVISFCSIASPMPCLGSRSHIARQSPFIQPLSHKLTMLSLQGEICSENPFQQRKYTDLELLTTLSLIGEGVGKRGNP